ncbi:MAG: glycosyltransferase family 4 protein [Candidatus Promineofilum sp.]|nr:glycosyltransferase family 4 protein [Promineifilum sp.]
MTFSPSQLSHPYAHIGINAHLLATTAGYRRAGIHQYIYQIIRHLPPAENTRYTVYTRLMEGWDRRADRRLAGTRLPTDNRIARIVWEQAVWPLQARRDGLTLMHSMAFVTPRLAPCPVVVTIYDLSFIENPEAFPAAQRRYLMAETAHSCRHAARLVAISDSGRHDIHRLYGVPLERIDIVRPGVAAHYRPLPGEQVAAFREQQGLPDQFLLHVGTLQPRKNIPTLLDAVARLNRPEVTLVLVGGKGWIFDSIYERVETLGLSGRVRFAGYVDDEQLPLWYNAAAALVMPSYYEGFGLPVAEALACGTPVVAAATSSLPEAGGDLALYFDPRDADALAACLARALDDPAVGQTARAAGPDHAARFSWSRAGADMAAIYRRVAAETGRSRG